MNVHLDVDDLLGLVVSSLDPEDDKLYITNRQGTNLGWVTPSELLALGEHFRTLGAEVHDRNVAASLARLRESGELVEAES